MIDFVSQFVESKEAQTTRQNTEAFHLHEYRSRIVIDHKNNKDCLNRLVIFKDTAKFALQPVKTQLRPPQRTRFFSCFIGLMPVLNKYFIVMGQEVMPVCSMEGKDIFQLRTVSFIALQDQKSLYADKNWQSISALLVNIRKLFSYGFYYSYLIDLSLSRQAYADSAKTDLTFCWNSFISKDLLVQPYCEWFTPLIQGYVDHFSSFVLGKKMQYFLISRRSWKMGGTRFNARGIDQEGNVANFIETQQILDFNGKIYSHSQIRGSVPLFWRQTGSIQIQVAITKRQSYNKEAFRKHFQQLQKKYSRVMCVNLLCKQKPQEQLLTEQFEELIAVSSPRIIRYQFFDLHSVCRGKNYQLVNKLVLKMSEVLKQFGFYTEAVEEQTTQRIQFGVVRMNCLDCLDRTNLSQAKFAIFTLENILAQALQNPSLIVGDGLLEQFDDPNNKQPFVENLRRIWADNGDMLSYHYTGTGSTHTSVTREGGANLLGLLKHSLKSIQRLYVQNFEDGVKQEAIEVLVGEHLLTKNLKELKIWKDISDSLVNI